MTFTCADRLAADAPAETLRHADGTCAAVLMSAGAIGDQLARARHAGWWFNPDSDGAVYCPSHVPAALIGQGR